MVKKIPRIRKDFYSIKKETTKAILFVDFDGKEYWVPKSICTLIKKKKDKIIATLAVFKFEEIEKIKVESLDSLFIDTGGKAKEEFICEKLELLESREYPLLPEQKKILEKIIQLRYSALFFETGTGKTLCSLTIANTRLQNGLISSILIFVPASLKGQWKAEIGRYFPNLTNYKILSIHATSFDKSFEKIKKEIEYFSYEKTQLIIDESHLIKNQSAKRSRRIYHLLNYKYAMILTATPIGRNAGDLFYQFGAMNKAILGFENYTQFSNNFLLKGGSDGEKVVALKNTEGLAKMIAPYIFNLKKTDVIETLPKKKYIKIYFEMTKNQATAYKKLTNLILEFRSKTGWLPDKKAFTFTILLQKITSGFIPTDEELQNFFSELGRYGKGAENFAKVKEVVYEITKEKNKRLYKLKEILAEIDKKVIVFFKYLSEKDAILELYPDSAIISGETKDIQGVIENFKNSKANLILINQAMATGFNLQFIDTAIYFTTTFDLIARKQSEERIFGRIGGKAKEVTFIDLIAKHSIDEHIQDVLDYKVKISDIFNENSFN